MRKYKVQYLAYLGENEHIKPIVNVNETFSISMHIDQFNSFTTYSSDSSPKINVCLKDLLCFIRKSDNCITFKFSSEKVFLKMQSRFFQCCNILDSNFMIAYKNMFLDYMNNTKSGHSYSFNTMDVYDIAWNQNSKKLVIVTANEYNDEVSFYSHNVLTGVELLTTDMSKYIKFAGEK